MRPTTSAKESETWLDGTMVRAIPIYLSGPMTGMPNWNAFAFVTYAEVYRKQGFLVYSPWELDKGDHTREYRYYLHRDLDILLDPDRGIERIYMLPGWEQSTGAKLEKHAAEAVGIAVYDAVTGEPYVVRGQGFWEA